MGYGAGRADKAEGEKPLKNISEIFALPVDNPKGWVIVQGMKTLTYKGHTITNTWPKQWEVTREHDQRIHLFGSLGSAKGWIDDPVANKQSERRTIHPQSATTHEKP